MKKKRIHRRIFAIIFIYLSPSFLLLTLSHIHFQCSHSFFSDATFIHWLRRRITMALHMIGILSGDDIKLASYRLSHFSFYQTFVLILFPCVVFVVCLLPPSLPLIHVTADFFGIQIHTMLIVSFSSHFTRNLRFKCCLVRFVGYCVCYSLRSQIRRGKAYARASKLIEARWMKNMNRMLEEKKIIKKCVKENISSST